MRREVYATTGRNTSKDYIKVALFDWLADDYLLIDDTPAEEVVKRVEKLAPIFSVDDVMDHAVDEGITFTDALEDLEEEARNM